jgi:hypothetical protein
MEKVLQLTAIHFNPDLVKVEPVSANRDGQWQFQNFCHND